MRRLVLVLLLGVGPAAAMMHVARRGLAPPTAPLVSAPLPLFRDAKSAFDPYTQNPTPTEQQYLRDHFLHMIVYTPYFDARTAWYPAGCVYKDLYAIGNPSALATAHPEYILKDAGGNNLYIPFNCSGGTCPQYAADPGNSNFVANWISEMQAVLGNGAYSCIYLDDVNLLISRVGNGSGVATTPIDPRTGSPMPESAWRGYLADMLTTLRTTFPGKEFVQNALWYPGTTDPNVQRQLAATDWLGVERGVNDSGIVGGSGTFGIDNLYGVVDYVHGLGKRVFWDTTSSDTALSGGREYQLATAYLLTAGAGLNEDAIGNTSDMTPDDLWSGYTVALGKATSIRTVFGNVWRRDFEHGFVLVNKPGAATQTVGLGGTYLRLDGSSVSSVTLTAAQGAVLRDVSAPPVLALPRSMNAGGWIKKYDATTVTPWPQKLVYIEADATTENANIKTWKAASRAAGNFDARYDFYSSLTSIDTGCGCRDATMFNALVPGHEDYLAHTSGTISTGNRISTFISQLGTGRQIATDIGNPAFVTAFANYQIATMNASGYDGLFADNIICAWDVGTNWSAAPFNPRTGQTYTMADYRADLATALGTIHTLFAAAGKTLIGNHGGSCVHDYTTDASVRLQLANMDGGCIENCVFDFWNGSTNPPLNEANWLDELRYLSAGNAADKRMECLLQHGGVDANHRDYGAASYLLTRGTGPHSSRSFIGELNGSTEYWTNTDGGPAGLDTNLGAPVGDFYCLDPSTSYARTEHGASGCPGTGKIYGRDFARGKVMVNPRSTAANSAPLGLTSNYLCGGTPAASTWNFPAQTGAVCALP